MGASPALRRVLVDIGNKLRKQTGIGGGHDTVAEVEDVARVSGVAAKDVRCGLEHRVGPGEHERRVEIALYDGVGTKAEPRFVDRGAPVEAHDPRTGRVHRLEEVSAADTEVNARCTWMTFGQRGKHTLRVGEDETVVINTRQSPGPRVEQLKRSRTC